ncbi:hypothetical protein R1sor_022944 [Riccia sorocarpa]|uniref:Reverse transcriptase domain-containing protein n=1 Tax=Riccia sorocarpa TaxID=122646 RepID=A0ABD3GM18_9MARC
MDVGAGMGQNYRPERDIRKFLDFMKAYDRVAHRFLWDTLASMGMGEDTICRIKVLVVGGTSEVHINGSFTEEFTIGRGRRQGCLLVPMLFAMITQPLMRALREEERLRNIKGLNIGEGQSLLHELFADDTGICITAEERQFEKLKEIIEELESASGACLNLQKSIVMQLKPRPVPDWMTRNCCELAGQGRSFKYLGVKAMQQIAEGSGVGSLATGRELEILRMMGIGTLDKTIEAINNRGCGEHY